MRDLLHYPQSKLSRLYNSKSLKIKKLIWISDAINHNLITDLYLSRMILAPSFGQFEHFIVTISDQKVCIENPNDPNFSMQFHRQNIEP